MARIILLKSTGTWAKAWERQRASSNSVLSERLIERCPISCGNRRDDRGLHHSGGRMGQQAMGRQWQHLPDPRRAWWRRWQAVTHCSSILGIAAGGPHFQGSLEQPQQQLMAQQLFKQLGRWFRSTWRWRGQSISNHHEIPSFFNNPHSSRQRVYKKAFPHLSFSYDNHFLQEGSFSLYLQRSTRRKNSCLRGDNNPMLSRGWFYEKIHNLITSTFDVGTMEYAGQTNDLV